MNSDKFVFFDIDGTLYSLKYKIPDSTREAIDRLKRNGHHPVICTGRTRVMIMEKVLELGFDGILSGAGSSGEWKEEELFLDELEVGDAADIVTLFRECGFHPYPEGTRFLYYDPLTDIDPKEEARRIFSLEKEGILKPFHENADDIQKVSAIFTKNSDPERFIQAVKNRYIAVNHYNILLETFPKGTSKGHGVRRLIEHLGADMEHTYAYGDSFNDLEMLEEVRYGVCMGNGDPKLLARTKFHAGRLEEDGIYHSLKEFGLI